MFKKILIISVLLLTLTISILFADKSLERIANEKGVEAETLYNEKKYVLNLIKDMLNLLSK